MTMAVGFSSILFAVDRLLLIRATCQDRGTGKTQLTITRDQHSWQLPINCCVSGPPAICNQGRAFPAHGERRHVGEAPTH